MKFLFLSPLKPSRGNEAEGFMFSLSQQSTEARTAAAHWEGRVSLSVLKVTGSGCCLQLGSRPSTGLPLGVDQSEAETRQSSKLNSWPQTDPPVRGFWPCAWPGVQCGHRGVTHTTSCGREHLPSEARNVHSDLSLVAQLLL